MPGSGLNLCNLCSCSVTGLQELHELKLPLILNYFWLFKCVALFFYLQDMSCSMHILCRVLHLQAGRGTTRQVWFTDPAEQRCSVKHLRMSFRMITWIWTHISYMKHIQEMIVCQMWHLFAMWRSQRGIWDYLMGAPM